MSYSLGKDLDIANPFCFFDDDVVDVLAPRGSVATYNVQSLVAFSTVEKTLTAPERVAAFSSIKAEIRALPYFAWQIWTPYQAVAFFYDINAIMLTSSTYIMEAMPRECEGLAQTLVNIFLKKREFHYGKNLGEYQVVAAPRTGCPRLDLFYSWILSEAVVAGVTSFLGPEGADPFSFLESLYRGLNYEVPEIIYNVTSLVPVNSVKDRTPIPYLRVDESPPNYVMEEFYEETPTERLLNPRPKFFLTDLFDVVEPTAHAVVVKVGNDVVEAAVPAKVPTVVAVTEHKAVMVKIEGSTLSVDPNYESQGVFLPIGENRLVFPKLFYGVLPYMCEVFRVPRGAHSYRMKDPANEAVYLSEVPGIDEIVTRTVARSRPLDLGKRIMPKNRAVINRVLVNFVLRSFGFSEGLRRDIGRRIMGFLGPYSYYDRDMVKYAKVYNDRIGRRINPPVALYTGRFRIGKQEAYFFFDATEGCLRLSYPKGVDQGTLRWLTRYGAVERQRMDYIGDTYDVSFYGLASGVPYRNPLGQWEYECRSFNARKTYLFDAPIPICFISFMEKHLIYLESYIRWERKGTAVHVNLLQDWHRKIHQSISEKMASF